VVDLLGILTLPVSKQEALGAKIDVSVICTCKCSIYFSSNFDGLLFFFMNSKLISHQENA